HGGAVQISRQIGNLRELFQSHQTEEDGLQHVFCVSGVSGDAIRRPEYQVLMFKENLFQPRPEIFSGHGCRVCLRYLHCGLQLSTVLLSRTRTREEARLLTKASRIYGWLS